MAGRQITICSKQVFTFNQAASSTSTVFVGARAYTALEAVSGELLVRVAAQSQPTNCVFTIGLANTLVMPDDPSTLYTPASSDPGANVVFLQVLAADTGFPRLYPKGFSSGCGAMFTAYITCTTGAAAGSATITCGIDVVLRDS